MCRIDDYINWSEHEEHRLSKPRHGAQCAPHGISGLYDQPCMTDHMFVELVFVLCLYLINFIAYPEKKKVNLCNHEVCLDDVGHTQEHL